MVQYNLKKSKEGKGKDSPDRNTDKKRPSSLDLSDTELLMDGDAEFLERFDSRGKKIRLRRGKIKNPVMDRLEKSYAVINFHPQTLITQKDLKQRATSVVYSKYKALKRQFAVQEQQRRLNWFRSVVISKQFAKNLLKDARRKLQDQQKRESEQRAAHRDTENRRGKLSSNKHQRSSMYSQKAMHHKNSNDRIKKQRSEIGSVSDFGGDGASFALK